LKRIYLIDYNIFCQRRGFKLNEWLEKNTSATYEDLCNILVNISVNPPSEEFFNEVKLTLSKDSFPEKENVSSLKKEEVKVKRKRKRRAKNEKNNI